MEAFVLLLPERENDAEELEAIVENFVIGGRQSQSASQPADTADNLSSGIWYVVVLRRQWLVFLAKGAKGGNAHDQKRPSLKREKRARAVGPERAIRRDKSVPTPKGGLSARKACRGPKRAREGEAERKWGRKLPTSPGALTRGGPSQD